MKSRIKIDKVFLRLAFLFMIGKSTLATDCSSSTAVRIDSTPLTSEDWSGSTTVTTANNFKFTPAECESDYSFECVTIAGSESCATVDNDRTKIAFSASTGQVSFSSTDVWNQYPNRGNNIIIKILAKSKTNAQQQALNYFYIAMIGTDPCLKFTWTLTEPTPFPTLTRHAVNDEAQLSIPWTTDGLASWNVIQYCGPKVVELFMVGTDASIDPILFTDQRGLDGQNSFIINPSIDMTALGFYDINYKVSIQPKLDYTRYPQTISGSSFRIELYDKCVTNELVSQFSENFPTAVEYILTDQKEIIFPRNFIPARCSFSIESITTDPVGGEPAFTYKEEAEKIVVTFDYITDLLIAGSYQLVFNLASAKGEPFDHKVPLTMIIPCENPLYVTMEGVSPAQQTYRIMQESLAEPYTFVHPTFTIVTQPQSNTACGTSINYTATIDGTDVTLVQMSPITYNPLTNTFSIYSESQAYVGFKTIAIRGELDGYPKTNHELTFQLEVTDPCLVAEAISLTNQSQQSRATFDFTNSPFIFDFVQPVVVPSFCTFNVFECSMAGSSPRTDLCDLNQSYATTSFDSKTGKYSFQSLDATQFPTGIYIYQITASIGVGPVASIVSTIEMEIVNPCPTSSLKIKYPIANMEYIYSSNSEEESDLSQSYNVQQLVENTKTNADCGLYSIKFWDQTSLSSLLERKIDDGTNDSSVLVQEGTENRVFTIKADQEKVYMNTDVVVGYKVYLLNYENVAVDEFFQVYYFNKEDEAVIIPEEPVTAEIVPQVEEKKPSDEEAGRPRFTPFWLNKLPDASIRFGGGRNLEYKMGEARSAYGDQMQVEFDFGSLVNATQYDADSHMIVIYHDNLVQADIGTHNIVVNASYQDPNNDTVSFRQIFKVIVYEAFDLGQEQGSSVSPVIINDDQEEFKNLRPEELFGDIITREQLAVLQAKESGLKPYIKEFNWDGQVRIAFTEQLQLQKDVDLQSLPSQRVAIEVPQKDERDKNYRRHLNKVLWKQGDREFELVSAIEIKILNESDNDDNQKVALFQWNVIDFVEDELILKLSFSDPGNLLDTIDDDYAEIQFTFWAANLFTAAKNTNETLPIGSSISWKVSRLVDENEIKDVATIHERTQWGFFALGVIIMVLALWCGPLLPVWMFINSLQLMVHIPMLRSRLPAITNLFFLDYLNLLRLHVGGLNKILADFVGLEGNQEEDYRSINNGTYYNELIKSCGYQTNLLHNLIIVLTLLIILSLMWLLLAFKGKVCQTGSRYEIWFNNFMVRFLYEIFFEVSICLMISYSSVDFQHSDMQTRVCWVIALAFTLITLGAVCYLGLLCVRGGPYIEGSYQPKSLMRSFWHFREINHTFMPKQPQNDTSEDHIIQDSQDSGENQLQSEVKQIEEEEKVSTEQVRAQLHLQLQLPLEKISFDSSQMADYSQAQLEPINYCTSEENGREAKVFPMMMGLANSRFDQNASVMQENPVFDADKKSPAERECSASESQFSQYEGGELITDKNEKHSMKEPKLQTETKSHKYAIEAHRKAKLLVEAKIRVVLQSHVKLNPRYNTIFTGLKKNHPHNIALLHPLFFLARRIAYAAIIIFLHSKPYFAALALLFLTLACFSFVLIYHQWESSIINQQHIINEVALYTLLLFLFLFCSITVEKDGSELLGNIMIAILLSVVAYNAVVILIVTVRFAKLFLLKLKNKLIALGQRNAVIEMKKIKIKQPFEISSQVQEVYDDQDEEQPYRPSLSLRGRIEIVDDACLRKSARGGLQIAKIFSVGQDFSSRYSCVESSRELIVDNSQPELLEEQKVACSNTSRDMIRMLSQGCGPFLSNREVPEQDETEEEEEEKQCVQIVPWEQSAVHQTAPDIKGKFLHVEETKSSFMGVAVVIKDSAPVELEPSLALDILETIAEPLEHERELAASESNQQVTSITMFERDAVGLLQSLEPKSDSPEEQPELTQDDDMPEQLELVAECELRQAQEPIHDINDEEAPFKDLALSKDRLPEVCYSIMSTEQILAIAENELTESIQTETDQEPAEEDYEDLVQEVEKAMNSELSRGSLEEEDLLQASSLGPLEQQIQKRRFNTNDDRCGGGLLDELDDLFEAPKDYPISEALQQPTSELAQSIYKQMIPPGTYQEHKEELKVNLFAVDLIPAVQLEDLESSDSEVEEEEFKEKSKVDLNPAVQLDDLESSNSVDSEQSYEVVGSLPGFARKDLDHHDDMSQTFFKKNASPIFKRLNQVKEPASAAQEKKDKSPGSSPNTDLRQQLSFGNLNTSGIGARTNTNFNRYQIKPLGKDVKFEEPAIKPNLKQMPRYLRHLQTRTKNPMNNMNNPAGM